MNARCRRVVAAACLVGRPCAGSGAAHVAGDDTQSLSAELEAAKKRATEETYLLRYRFTKGETICWKVKHLSTTEATIQGKTETTKSRTISTKVWEVQDVDADGNMTLVHSVSDIDMWQKISDNRRCVTTARRTRRRRPVHACRQDGEHADLDGQDDRPAGKVLNRDGAPPQVNLGLGEIAIPLPAEPVKIGQQWQTSSEIPVAPPGRDEEADQDADGVHAQVRQDGCCHDRSEDGSRDARQRSADPVPVGAADHGRRDPIRCGRAVGSWVAKSTGTRRSWVSTGHDSLMKYLARFTEELQPAAETAQQTGSCATVGISRRRSRSRVVAGIHESRATAGFSGAAWSCWWPARGC